MVKTDTCLKIAKYLSIAHGATIYYKNGKFGITKSVCRGGGTLWLVFQKPCKQ